VPFGSHRTLRGRVRCRTAAAALREIAPRVAEVLGA